MLSLSKTGLTIKGSVRSVRRELEQLGKLFDQDVMLQNIVDQLRVLKEYQCTGWNPSPFAHAECSNIILNGDVLCRDCDDDRRDRQEEMRWSSEDDDGDDDE
jgi:hypothetical protein